MGEFSDQLLREEYVALSPNSSENLKFYTMASEDSGFPDTQKRVVGRILLCLTLCLRLTFFHLFHLNQIVC